MVSKDHQVGLRNQAQRSRRIADDCIAQEQDPAQLARDSVLRWIEIQPDLTSRFAVEMDHAQGVRNQVHFADRFVNRYRGELRHLIRARDEVSTATPITLESSVRVQFVGRGS